MKPKRISISFKEYIFHDMQKTVDAVKNWKSIITVWYKPKIKLIILVDIIKFLVINVNQ